MLQIGNMLWRIGEVLDFDRQLAWTREAGFDGVGFHASAGVPGQWRGIDPGACSAAARQGLQQEIERFSFAEIHAPFEIELRDETLVSGIAALKPILDFARDLGVGVVTVHARIPGADAAAGWLVPMRELDAEAARAQTRIALEIAGGFDAVMGWGLSKVGVNLDVGHMY